MAFLCSCGSIYDISPPAVAPTLVYSMIFIIHGDGDYLYHDRNGNEIQADENTLAAATKIAQKNPNAEVFIFHEKTRRHLLFFFPLPDGEFYYYRNGSLITKKSYWRGNGDFKTEVELYDRSREQTPRNLIKLFLYFGHEIPEYGGQGYDASYPEREFTIHNLAAALGAITQGSSKFDLLILSTCFNGTPYSVAALSPYARYIVASPDNLHLSYFYLGSLENLNTRLTREDVPIFAGKFAQEAFDRLEHDVQTSVTVAVYDVNRVQGYLWSVDSVYSETLRLLEKDRFAPPADHCDCAEDSAYVRPGMSDGVYILYRPPQFGRLKNKLSHSGWECWEEDAKTSTVLKMP